MKQTDLKLPVLLDQEKSGRCPITLPARELHAKGEITRPVIKLAQFAETLPMDQFLAKRDCAELQQYF